MFISVMLCILESIVKNVHLVLPFLGSAYYFNHIMPCLLVSTRKESWFLEDKDIHSLWIHRYESWNWNENVSTQMKIRSKSKSTSRARVLKWPRELVSTNFSNWARNDSNTCNSAGVYLYSTPMSNDPNTHHWRRWVPILYSSEKQWIIFEWVNWCTYLLKWSTTWSLLVVWVLEWEYRVQHSWG